MLRRAWLLMVLLPVGCHEDCPTVPGPAASCVRIALDQQATLMVVTPECGIANTDVQVDSLFSGISFTVRVDGEGRSNAQILPAGSQDQLLLRWGGDCKTELCVVVMGPGPARECDVTSQPLPE